MVSPLLTYARNINIFQLKQQKIKKKNAEKQVT